MSRCLRLKFEVRVPIPSSTDHPPTPPHPDPAAQCMPALGSQSRARTFILSLGECEGAGETARVLAEEGEGGRESGGEGHDGHEWNHESRVMSCDCDGNSAAPAAAVSAALACLPNPTLTDPVLRYPTKLCKA